MRSPSIVPLAAALGAMTLGSSGAYSQELIAQKALSLDVAFAIARAPIRTGNDHIGAIGVGGALRVATRTKLARMRESPRLSVN